MKSPPAGNSSPKGSAVHADDAPAALGKELHGSAANPAAAPVISATRSAACVGGFALPVVSLIDLLSGKPSPASRLRMVFQCTRSQATGLELALCGASMTLSIRSRGLPAGKRLGFEDIQGGAGDDPFLQGFHQGGFIDHRPA